MKIKKLLPGALLLFLCLLCGLGIAGAFFRPVGKITEEPRLVGTRDIVINVGDVLPDLKEGLGVNDAVKEVEIDTSAVDTGTAGEYPILYRYTDQYGKVYEKRTTCTVTAREEVETSTEAFKQEAASGEEIKDGAQTEVKKEQSEGLRTTPPQTGDTTNIFLYAVLFLISFFLCLFLLLRLIFG